MIEFPTNVSQFPNYIYHDLSNENLDLVKPYEFIFNNNNPLIGLVGFSILSGEQLRFTVTLVEFLGRFQPVLSVEQLRQLTDLFKSLDSNSFFGGSFPNISLLPKPETLIEEDTINGSLS